MTNISTEKIKSALIELGITGKIDIKEHGCFCVDVYVNGEWYGLWDCVKNTFIE